jgi:hypothetical protein
VHEGRRVRLELEFISDANGAVEPHLERPYVGGTGSENACDIPAKGESREPRMSLVHTHTRDCARWPAVRRIFLAGREDSNLAPSRPGADIHSAASIALRRQRIRSIVDHWSAMTDNEKKRLSQLLFTEIRAGKNILHGFTASILLFRES